VHAAPAARARAEPSAAGGGQRPGAPRGASANAPSFSISTNAAPEDGRGGFRVSAGRGSE
jgi:hypothetical protein